MENKIETRRKVVKTIIWVVVIVALLATTHILVNYFDLFEFVKKMHGG
jgi:hypothetical protein